MTCECPYCEHDCGDYFDDCHSPDTEYEHKCEECGKNFIFIIDYYPTFSSYKADCLNGGEHNWKKICGYPVEYFENRMRCADCGKEKVVGDEK
jgi:hypothetical protein